MAETLMPDRREAAAADQKLYTLSEISHHTGISMPTLQRYKKTYQDRIPSVGTGRKQRYPEHALPVFGELRTENASKRGRPRKNAADKAKPAGAKARRSTRPARGAAKGARAAGAAKATAATRGARRGRPPGRTAAAQGSARGARGARNTRGAGSARVQTARAKTEGLLTLTQISKTTGISYPTLVRYVRLHSNRLPHEGKGRARRFYREAVEVFRSLRQESGRGGRRGRAAATGARRGRPPKAAAAVAASGFERLEGALVKRIRDLERFQQAIEKRIGGLVKGLQKLR
jgi:predicted DNA-binding transcriptional regulator AlpA